MPNIIKLTSLLGLLANISITSASEPITQKTLEKEGFLFEFRGCKNISNADAPLVCEFKVENRQKNRRQFNFDPKQSRIIDGEGNEIRGITGNLGNREEPNSNSSSYGFNQPYPLQGTELVNGIPIKGSIEFEKAPEGEILLVDLRCYEQNPNYVINYFNVEFRF